MSAQQALAEFADIASWSSATQIQLLCRFIDEAGEELPLAEWLNAQLKWEDECSAERAMTRTSGIAQEEAT